MSVEDDVFIPEVVSTVSPEAEPQTDAKPQTEDSLPDGYVLCPKCNVTPVAYKGRGKRPHCDSCKGSRGGVKRVGGGNDALARQATTLLCQVNGIVAMGLFPLGFPATSSAIAGANADFEKQAYEALLADPQLCRLILRSGKQSGRVALTLAYSMMAFSVVPVAYMELRERRASKAS